MRTLCVLLWKDLMMAKRQKFNTIYRMVSPLLLMFLAIYIRSKASTDESTDDIKLKEEKFLDNKTTASRCILYTPNSNLAGILMDEVGRQLGLSRLTVIPHRSPCNGYCPYSSYSEITELVMTFSKNETAVCIIFEDMDVESWSSRQQDRLTYTIQMNGKFKTRSFMSTGVILTPEHQHYGDIYDDFIHIQKAIDTSYIKVRTGQNKPQKLSVKEFPHFRGKAENEAKWIETTLLCLVFFYIMLFSTINLFTHIMARMCRERAAGIQELIKMNGVSATTMGIAYFISSIPPALSFSIGCSIMLKMGDSPIIEYTSGIYIFFGLALYAVSLLAFGMACSYVSKTSRFATVIALFVFIATIVIIKYILLRPPKNWALIFLSGMVWHVPLFWIFHEIFVYEYFGKPLTISDINSKYNMQGSVLEGYICLILQSLMYFALTWYLSYVRQGQYGNSLPWNFLCKKKVDESVIACREVPEERDSSYFEEPPTSKPVGIQIINVSKYYQKPALSDVSLDVYKGEITVLLGHNGAGKTTLMSIITGMVNASQGKVLVNGLDTASNSLQVRRELGLCTQHNLFIDRINVIEHVLFFNMLKGKSNEPRADCQELLDKLGIGKKASAMPEELSGGMKRRLQLACALAGGSDVLVLDEPTSGLDVETRRELWNLLLSLRGERTVLLSTHFMEEADALGDRVAALHTGHLRCNATPMYLKKAMGGGYRLSLITSGKPKETKITAMVTQHVSGTTVRDELMNTITYNLPSAATPQFPALFAALEANRSSLEINSIGVGVSTMEEVFLFLCSDSDTFIKKETDTEVPVSEYGKIKGKYLYKRQAIVLIKRHLNFLRESFKSFPILQIIFPALLIYLFTLTCNNKEDSTESPNPRTLMEHNTSMYKPLPDRWALYSTVFGGAAPVALNLLSNVVATQFLVAGRRAITNYSHPLDETELDLPPASGAKDVMLCGFWAVLVGCVTLFASHNLHALPTREGESGARHLHVMAGCPAALHWLCTLAFHTALTLLTLVPIVIICAYACDTDNTFRNARFLLILGLILILGNIAFFGLTYLLVISFKRKTSSGLAIGFILWGGLLSLMKVTGDILGTKMAVVEDIFIILTNILPSFAMMVGIGQAAYVARLNALCELHKNLCPKMLLLDNGFDEENCCAGESKAYISFGEFAPGAQILILLVQGIIFMTLVILVQLGYVSCFCDRLFNRKFKEKPVSHVDELVAAEAALVDQEIELPVQQILNHNRAVLVSHLHKNYAGMCTKHHAVKGISFSVQKGECFGLLGLNGAGKSTTFKMMTSEVCPTFGRIYANGVFLHKQKTTFLRNIGYCPQFLGIDEFQTANDNLRTLLTIRGLDDGDIDKEIKAWINVVGLQRYANIRASGYSGGYKRRLATAAALCSGAPLSLLDEPTAGVDVGARRLVHSALRKALSLGDSIVITSHSMDEMEALCTRIAILSAGNIRALGTSAELRTKYAQGYALIFKVNPEIVGESEGKNGVDDLKVAVTVMFNCELKDEHTTMLHYHIKNKMDYSEIFTRLEDLRMLFPDTIEDYSVNETTLEEVFLHLAKELQMEKQAAEIAALEAKTNKHKPEQSGTSSKV